MPNIQCSFVCLDQRNTFERENETPLVFSDVLLPDFSTSVATIGASSLFKELQRHQRMARADRISQAEMNVRKGMEWDRVLDTSYT
jgi:hypothetical protein